MATLVLRQNLQRKLTVAEVDQNFENLNSDKLERSNNLADLNDAAASRGNLGLGALAVQGDASGVPIVDAGGNFTASDVEAALAEEADARQTHEADTSNPHSVDASQVPVTDASGNFTATDVEGALGEEADARQAHEAATTGIHGIPGAASIVHTDNLAANGGTVPEEDRANTFQLAQTFKESPSIIKTSGFAGVRFEAYRDTVPSTRVLLQSFAARGTESTPSDLGSGDESFRITVKGQEGGTETRFSDLKFVYTGSSSGYWNFDAEVRQNQSPVLVDGDLAANGGSVAELDNVQTWTADQTLQGSANLVAATDINGSGANVTIKTTTRTASDNVFEIDRNGTIVVRATAGGALVLGSSNSAMAAGTINAAGFYDNGNKLGTNAYGDRTVSTAAPSGGSNGDVWLQVD